MRCHLVYNPPLTRTWNMRAIVAAAGGSLPCWGTTTPLPLVFETKEDPAGAAFLRKRLVRLITPSCNTCPVRDSPY